MKQLAEDEHVLVVVQLTDGRNPERKRSNVKVNFFSTNCVHIILCSTLAAQLSIFSGTISSGVLP